MKKILISSALTLLLAFNSNANTYYGSELFTEGFINVDTTQFEPSYIVAVGDSINISLYGAVTFTDSLKVDPNGNISSEYFPPIKVSGVAYVDLNEVIQKSLSERYKDNVHMYSYLDAATPVRVTVSGAVNKPGVYSGVNSDNPISLLTRAGGINQERGSIKEVSHIRHGKVITTYDLQQYIHSGLIQRLQFHQGDVLHVGIKKGYINVTGDATFTGQIDIGEDAQGSDLLSMISLKAGVTHFRVQRVSNSKKETQYLSIDQLPDFKLNSGDSLDFITDVKITDVSVRVLGEHLSGFEHTFNHGATLDTLMNNIELSSLSSRDIQLFRKSVRIKQKERLNAQLDQLQRTALTTPSDTESTALLRRTESTMMLEWIATARNAEPKGQVVIPQGAELGDIVLEDGDVIVIPPNDSVIQVNGEVTFPNAYAFSEKLKVEDYIDMSGGLVNEESRIMILSRSGAASFGDMDSRVNRGDEIFVLPEVDEKEFQFAKDMTQILYQIAASAAIIIGV